MGEIYKGNVAIDAIYRGQTAIDKVYRGQTEVWSSAVGPVVDPDAQAFFNTIDGEGITLTQTEKDAVDALVVGLKADSLWTKMDALYPFVGSDPDSAKYNLKDPQDTDAAYRITWYDVVSAPNVFNADGVTIGADYRSNGMTYIDPSIYNTTDGVHMSVWCNNINNVKGYDMGALSTTIQDWALIISYGNSRQYANFAGTSYITSTHTPAENFYMSNNNGTTTELVRGNTVPNSGTETINTTGWDGTRLITIGGSYRGVPGEVDGDSVSGRGYGFASMGEGLDSTERSNFYTRVNTFITSLSR